MKYRWVLVLGGLFCGALLAGVVCFALIWNPDANDNPFFGCVIYNQMHQQISLWPGDIKLILSPFTIYANFPGQKTALCSINSQGFRGPEISEKPPGVSRVIFLGGSAVFGFLLKSEAVTIPALLESENTKIQAINAGVVGYLSGQELTSLVTNVSDLDPDIVVSYSGWNDLYNTWVWAGRAFIEPGCNPYHVDIGRRLRKLHEAEVNLLRSVRMVWDRLSYRMRKPRSAWGFVGGLRSAKRPPGWMETAASVYANNLSKMNDFCAGRGGRFLVVFQPEMGQRIQHADAEDWQVWGPLMPIYREQFPALYADFLARVKLELDKKAIPYLDIGAEPDFLNPPEPMFVDPVHTSVEGNRVVARLIDRYLMRQGWIQEEAG